MAKKINFTIVSKDENYSFTEDDEKKLLLDNPDLKETVSFTRISNNKSNITSVYNRVLEHERNSKENDIVVFLHADVSMDFSHLIHRLSECCEKYDVIGLCGCQKINTSQSPLNWFTGSIPFPQFRWGCVTHGELGDRMSFFSGDRETIEDSQVACIDGLCIAFCPGALKTDLKFDEQFMFDLYDTDISFSALMKHNLRLGVVVEKSLKHFSVGKSILTNEFLVHEVDFRKKWNLPIPENSPIRKLSNQ